MKIFSRKIAEWMTLIISLVILMGLAGYLVFDLWTPSSSFIEIQAIAVPTESQRRENYFILPIDIQSFGQKTISYIKLKAEIEGPSDQATEEIELTYLGRNSKQRVYLYVSEDPQNLKVRIKPVYYYFD